MPDLPDGFREAVRYPFWESLFHRRSRRISQGIKEVRAGSLTYQSDRKAVPLSPLEEAMLIAVTGTTGVTLPDRPFQDAEGKNILGAPNLNFIGRAAGSTDNAQATSFFLLNDAGTYFLRPLPPLGQNEQITPEVLVSRAEKSKVRVLPGRLTFPREFPYYLDSNRFLSNVEGSTVLVPVVDMTRQYINALMYVLTEKEGTRPVLLDDRNFHRPAGVKKWIQSGFLNPAIKITLGALGTMRTHIEAELLLQNVMLLLQAMGLGGWIHAAIGPPYLLGHPYLAKENKGLGFDFVIPPRRWLGLLDLIRWGTPLPITRANPVGLRDLIRCYCPPRFKDMSAAVDAVVAEKFAEPGGLYRNQEFFGTIFRDGKGQTYVQELPKYEPQVIDCTKDICNYILETHGRFPAHVDAIYVPGVWIQAHHLDLEYYDTLFKPGYGYTETQRDHMRRWHGEQP